MARTQAVTDITHSIVRPTAFFKSVAGQVELVKTGKPFVMFGDGTLAACKPISEPDLAAFMADCVGQADKVGGQGGMAAVRCAVPMQQQALPARQTRRLPGCPSARSEQLTWAGSCVRPCLAGKLGACLERLPAAWGEQARRAMVRGRCWCSRNGRSSA